MTLLVLFVLLLVSVVTRWVYVEFTCGPISDEACCPYEQTLAEQDNRKDQFREEYDKFVNAQINSAENLVEMAKQQFDTPEYRRWKREADKSLAAMKKHAQRLQELTC